MRTDPPTPAAPFPPPPPPFIFLGLTSLSLPSYCKEKGTFFLDCKQFRFAFPFRFALYPSFPPSPDFLQAFFSCVDKQAKFGMISGAPSHVGAAFSPPFSSPLPRNSFEMRFRDFFSAQGISPESFSHPPFPPWSSRVKQIFPFYSNFPPIFFLLSLNLSLTLPSGVPHRKRLVFFWCILSFRFFLAFF